MARKWLRSTLVAPKKQSELQCTTERKDNSDRGGKPQAPHIRYSVLMIVLTGTRATFLDSCPWRNNAPDGYIATFL